MDVSPRRRGFTLVEVIVASVITAFVLGSLAMSMGQLGRAKETSRLRLDAHLRADAAMNNIRRDIASVVRHDDLFWTRLFIRSDHVRSPIGELDRDDILVFNTRLRAVYDLDFNGEGMQYESQYRIFETEDSGAMLWQRRDAVPDDFPLAGGIATPMVEGIIGLRLQAYDGIDWFDDWDSDFDGLPRAVRITIVASGARNGEDLYEAPIAILRTVVPIDRVIPPSDLFRPDEDDEDEEEEEEEELEDVTDYEAEAARLQQQQQQRGSGGVGTTPGGRPGAAPTPGGPTRPGAGDGGPRRPSPGAGGGGGNVRPGTGGTGGNTTTGPRRPSRGPS